MLVRSAFSYSALALFLILSPRLAGADQNAKSEIRAKKAPTHKRGGRPRVPKDRLPDDVPLPEADPKARHAIAEGPTSEELKQGAPDEELAALRDAEEILFSEQLTGARKGWNFELPAPEGANGHSLGLPFVSPRHVPPPELGEEDLAWLRSLTLPDLPIVLDRRVVTYLKFYRDSPQGRTIAAIWTKKSGRYVAEMKAQLRRAGLPTDLVWLSMIESGHNPTIKSPAGAVGLWQFMPESGRMYGLVVDRWVDERRDPARSTQAAVRFLSDLYRRFGNWELAMGAYNMGYAGMSRAVAKYSTNDYWSLSRLESGVPWETTLYVPKIFALAIVMNNRAAFGVGRTKLDPPVSFDTVLLEPATPLKSVARAAQVSLSTIKELNPQYLTELLPPKGPADGDKWPLRLPVGTGIGALSKLGAGKSSKHELYRTRLGDTVAQIAEEYGLSQGAFRRLNDLQRREELQPGTVLLVPEGAKRTESSEKLDVVVGRLIVPGQGQRRVFYRARSGDFLSQIASAFGVRESELSRWNLLNPTAFLRDGMFLQVLVDQDANLAQVRAIEEPEAQVYVAGSPQFHDHFEGLKGKQRILVTVRKGDTLARVGARHGMSVGSMERVNRRSRRQKLVVGEQLIVYTERKLSARSEELGVQPLPALPER